MTTPPKSVEAARRSLLDQIAAITAMQPGTLAEEWRGSSGPYYKHQVWKDGRNVSRRVPAEEAALLREDIDNAKRFAHLTGELARLNIEHTLALRAAQARDPDVGEGKKNSTRKRSGRDTPKRKPSSPKRGRP